MLELDLASAFAGRDPARAATLATAAAERANAAGDRTGELLADVAASCFRSFAETNPKIDELERLAKEALPLLEQAENHAGLFYVWSVLCLVANFLGRNEEWARAAEQALEHSHLAGRRDTGLFSLPQALTYGPRPADEALLTLDALLPETPHPVLLLGRSLLLTMLGRFGEADQIARESGDRIHDLTGDDRGEALLGEIAVVAGRHDDAVMHLGRYCDFLRPPASEVTS